MNPAQFDQVARLLAEHRLTRRAALAAGGGMAALGLSAAAQDATPVASPPPVASPTPEEGEHVTFMFVQTFGAGSLAPKAADGGSLLLTADHLAGQTLYFSDRPERIVGMVPTERFLGAAGTSGLGFAEPDPPNAALVLEEKEGEPGEAILVELIDPVYDPETGTITYELQPLEDTTQVDLQLVQEPLGAVDKARQFTAASLFIDDCANGQINCLDSVTSALVGVISPVGFCYNAAQICCAPCGNTDWEGQCTEKFGDACTHGQYGTACTYSWTQNMQCPEG